MRLFDRTIALDHALYDGALVKTFGEYSNWTESTLQAPPFTIEHFRRHTQRKLAESFRQVPDEGLGKGIARQDYSERRILLQHLAHCFVRLWGLDIHTHRSDVQEAVRCLRINLFEIIRGKKLLVIFENNPLRNHHTAKYEQTNEGMQPAIRMRDDDIALARYIAGPQPHMHGSPAINQYTLDILRAVEPFLTEIDETHIHRTLLHLRQKLRCALAGQFLQTSELQQKLLQLIADDWDDMHSSEDNAAALSTIEEEMARDTGAEHILDTPSQTILDQCFSVPLAAEQIDDTMRAKLLRRRPILEFLMHSALKRHDGEEPTERATRLRFFYDAVLPTVRSYFQKLDLRLGDLGHLGLILATHSQSVTTEELHNSYLV